MIAVEFFLCHYFHCNCSLNNSTRHDISYFSILRNYTNLKENNMTGMKNMPGMEMIILPSCYIIIRFNCYVLYEDRLENIIRTGMKGILLNFSSLLFSSIIFVHLPFMNIFT